MNGNTENLEQKNPRLALSKTTRNDKLMQKKTNKLPLMASFCAVLSPLDVLDEIWDVLESVSEGFLTYSLILKSRFEKSKELTKWEKGQLKIRHHHRHQQQEPGEQRFSLQVVTG